MVDGGRSVFGPEPWREALAERLDRCDIHPAAPLWGRGELRTTGAVRRLEEAALADDEAMVLRAGLESAGLRQERRERACARRCWPGSGQATMRSCSASPCRPAPMRPRCWRSWGPYTIRRVARSEEHTSELQSLMRI